MTTAIIWGFILSMSVAAGAAFAMDYMGRAAAEIEDLRMENIALQDRLWIAKKLLEYENKGLEEQAENQEGDWWKHGNPNPQGECS